MRKVMVTGARGFIGKTLVNRLQSMDFEVLEHHSAMVDITDCKAMAKLQLEGVEHVFHLAAKTFVPDSWSNPSEFYNVNVLGTINVLELCRKYKMSLTFISSYLYGQPEKLPISENSPLSPNNPYSHTKFLAEQACDFYSKQYGIRIAVIRPFNVFGIGQSEKFLIPTIIKQAVSAEHIKVKDLNPRRDYIYIEDLVNAIIQSRNAEDLFSVFNIGSGQSASVGEVINIVQQILHINKPVVSENSIRQNEIDDVIADIDRAKTELNWLPAVTLEEGLSKIIEHERSQCHERNEHSNK